jgi:hypothetical protein
MGVPIVVFIFYFVFWVEGIALIGPSPKNLDAYSVAYQ